MTTVVIPTVASRWSRFALGLSSGKDSLAERTWHHVTLITELPFELSDHLVVPSQSHLHLTTFTAPSSSTLVPIFLTFLIQIPTSLVSRDPPSSPALFWLQLFLPPSSPPLWKTPLYWGSNSSQFVPHKPVFSFTRWMFLLCADWTSHVWSHLPAGFRWILHGGNASHIASCPLTPEKEGFIEISGHMSGVFAPQSNVIYRPFTKYKNIVVYFLTLAQFTEYNGCNFNRFIRLESF